MKRLIILFITLIISLSFSAQELNCKVTVVADRVQNSNTQLFKTLESALNSYMNDTKWTNETYKQQEKIQCAITIVINEQTSADRFKANMQLQIVRPVFNSTYLTPIFNYNDKNFSFNYVEFETLIYNESSFESNLVSLMTFYAHTILGIDADTFAYQGGEEHFKKAENVMQVAQQGGFVGWNNIDGSTTRFKLIDTMLNNQYKDYRFAMFRYHRAGLDTMFDDKSKAKKTIAEAVTNIQRIYSKRPNAYLLRIFLDTKADEISTIFTDGPRIDTRGLVNMLMRVYPSRNNEWEKIH
jgi:hypothetical protein